MKIKTEKIIELSEWDKLVCETYGKPYSFQQQDGCKDRGLWRFTVPDLEAFDDNMNESIEETVNGPEEGVKFAVWLARDPKQPLNNLKEECRKDQWAIDLWWRRNFYPDFQTVANDLHARGLLPAGKYAIDIDW